MGGDVLMEPSDSHRCASAGMSGNEYKEIQCQPWQQRWNVDGPAPAQLCCLDHASCQQLGDMMSIVSNVGAGYATFLLFIACIACISCVLGYRLFNAQYFVQPLVQQTYISQPPVVIHGSPPNAYGQPQIAYTPSNGQQEAFAPTYGQLQASAPTYDQVQVANATHVHASK